ncbi:hypothetical protein FACS1894163_09430 [Spirochaetia bacterium]|nr:hypothetical protein FACS1894163_09430 [Spirochaetia bacterium]
MKRIGENNYRQILGEVRIKFIELTGSFERMVLPFTLCAYKDGVLVRMQEAEIHDIEQDYEEFKIYLNQLMSATSTFVKTDASPDFALENTGKNKGFTDFVSRNTNDAIDLYNGVVIYAKQEYPRLFNVLQNAYFAYTKAAKALNTAAAEKDAAAWRQKGMEYFRQKENHESVF